MEKAHASGPFEFHGAGIGGRGVEIDRKARIGDEWRNN
jgi:hypothetical protein